MADNIIAQPQWHWCEKCGALWHASSANPTGKCPAGDGHSATGSGDYALFDNPTTPFKSTLMAQPQWRWCSQCGSLWHPTSAKPTGFCAAPGSNGKHSEAGSGDYALLNDSSGSF